MNLFFGHDIRIMFNPFNLSDSDTKCDFLDIIVFIEIEILHRSLQLIASSILDVSDPKESINEGEKERNEGTQARSNCERLFELE